MFSVVAIWLDFKVNNGGVKLKYLYFDNSYATMLCLQLSREEVHVRVQAYTVQLNASYPSIVSNLTSQLEKTSRRVKIA